MIVLDIDLDFFLNRIPFPSSGQGRLSQDEFEPWTRDEVRSFLNDRCCVTERLPGAIVPHHHEVYPIWHQLISDNQLDRPFDVVHVDSHADLGLVFLARDPIRYVCSNFLHRPVDDRVAECLSEQSRLDPGNYLLFAVASQWLSSLRYVHHPTLNRDRPDIADVLFQNGQLASNTLQLPILPVAMENQSSRFTWHDHEELDRPVRFELIDGDGMQLDEPPSFLFVAHSPDFTPPRSDALLDIFREFIADS